MLALGYNAFGQQQIRDYQEVQHGEKVFLIDSVSTKVLRIANKQSVNLKPNYVFYNLSKAKFDGEQLASIVKSIFPQQKLDELQSKGLAANPFIGVTLHINRSGRICSVNYMLGTNTGITLAELSILENRMKKELVIEDFLFEDMEQLNYYSLNFSIRPQWVLEGRRWLSFNKY